MNVLTWLWLNLCPLFKFTIENELHFKVNRKLRVYVSDYTNVREFEDLLDFFSFGFT